MSAISPFKFKTIVWCALVAAVSTCAGASSATAQQAAGADPLAQARALLAGSSQPQETLQSLIDTCKSSHRNTPNYTDEQAFQCAVQVRSAASGGLGIAGRCDAAMETVTNALAGLGRYCSEASSVLMRPASASRSPSSSGNGAIRTCMGRLQDCATQEDAMGEELESGGAGTDLGDMSLSTSCNEMSAAQAEDLKQEGKDFETQMTDLQAKQVENTRKANDAASEDQRKQIDLQTQHEQAQTQNRQKEQEMADNWTQKLADVNRQKSELIAQAEKSYAELDQRYQASTQQFLVAQTQNRATIRRARSECEKRAAALMAKLEADRVAAIRSYSNNAGSMSALTGTVKKYESRYAQDLNNCLATDYRRTVEEANDTLNIAKAAYDQAKINMNTARAAMAKQMQMSQNSMDTQMQVEYQKSQTQLANLKNAESQEDTTYQRNIAQLQQATAMRKQTEQQEQMNLQRDMAKLQQKIQLNATRLAALRIQNPGAATTRTTGQRRTRAEVGLEKLSSYTGSYCRALAVCRAEGREREVPGVDPGTCRGPASTGGATGVGIIPTVAPAGAAGGGGPGSAPSRATGG